MTPELDENLTTSFPRLYAQRNGNMRDTCMCWGFDVGDGWYGIVHMLSASLTALMSEYGFVVEAAQVKEKFGGLRFYVDTEGNADFRKAVDEFIALAERLSLATCEGCGKYGKLRAGGWVQTLCDECNGDNDD